MTKRWWHDKVAYQIYPKSFCDSNGDGIGDLGGIISKLDYLKDLGVDIIWLSPIYESPFVDQGYDISDYYKIAQCFGTMEEFDTLLAEAKSRNMYVIMDLVVNHWSSQHKWFQEALANPKSEYRDYFYFVKGKNGQPPSNYRSYFGGSTWEPVKGEKDMYYLHMFAKEQPDLNWENPKVREQIYRMINWWLNKGLAGFRIDAIINIKKDLEFPSFEADGEDGLVSCTKMVDEVTGVGDFLKEMSAVTFEPKDAFTVGEVFNMKKEEMEAFIGEEGYFSSMFDFSAHLLTLGEHGWYDAKPVEFKAWRQTLISSQLEAEGIGFKSNIIENHDEPRGVCTFLPDYARNEQGKKMLATTFLTLRGIPFIYQGQEIGMTNCRRNDISEYDDINTHDQYQVALDAGLTKEEALKVCHDHSRDNSRTPMQWKATKHAGFTAGTPWLPVNLNYFSVNVETQARKPESLLNYYKELIALRKFPAYSEIFVYGDFVPAFLEYDNIFAYYRSLADTSVQILVIANYGREIQTLPLGNMLVEKVLLMNTDFKDDLRREARGKCCVTLQSCEAVVLLVSEI